MESSPNSWTNKVLEQITTRDNGCTKNNPWKCLKEPAKCVEESQKWENQRIWELRWSVPVMRDLGTNPSSEDTWHANSHQDKNWVRVSHLQCSDLHLRKTLVCRQWGNQSTGIRKRNNEAWGPPALQSWSNSAIFERDAANFLQKKVFFHENLNLSVSWSC